MSHVMDPPTRSAKLKVQDFKKAFAQAHAFKKRKVYQRTGIRVNIEGDPKRQKNEGAPSDSWSWRKYGQKPIKGSPYPRGYYRCSTSKGCSAKKQVERCSTDASVLIITYTSTHNHPGPDLPDTTIISPEPSQHYLCSPTEENPKTPKQEEEEMEQQQLRGISDGDHFHYCRSPFDCSQDIMINKGENLFSEDLGTNYESPTVVVNEKPVSYPPFMTLSDPKSEENDFYEELEELPTSSFFVSYTRKNFFEDRILVNPS